MGDWVVQLILVIWNIMELDGSIVSWDYMVLCGIMKLDGSRFYVILWVHGIL